MGVEGYDYPPDDRYVECERCHGTGWIYYIARSDGEGGVDESTFTEVDFETYQEYTDSPDAPAGEWVQCERETCPDCDGDGWIDEAARLEEEREIARRERHEAEREERAIREYLETHNA